MLKKTSALLAGLTLLLASSTTALASGFALIEQSVSGLGNAFAGGAASAEDATTVFFNPAGLTRLEGQQVVSALHVVAPSAKFNDSGSTTVLTTPMTGGDGGDGGVLGLVPNFYYSHRVNEKAVLGLGINAPFGLATEYDSSWVGRYHAIKSELQTININPTVAYKATEKLSIGFGLNAQYLKAELSNAIDFGTLDVANYGGAFGLTPQADDGTVVLEGDSWAFGYNLGILYEFTDDSRIGLAYRSRMIHDVEGTADFSNSPAGIVAASGFFVDTDVTSKANLPETLSLSYYHRFNPQWAIMADATWTNWSTFKELRFKFASGQPDGVTTENWDDSMRYSVGATYSPNEKLDLRMGVAFDETPIPDAQHRTPRIPCEDRLWLALGAGYSVNENLTLDFAYAHLFVDDPVIDKTATGEDALRGALQGTYDAAVDIASIQLNYKF